MSQIIELEGEWIELGKLCINLYGMRVDRFSGEGSRWFGLITDGKVCAVAWIHKPHIFTPIFRYFMIDERNSYFIRRVATCCPGDHAVALLQELIKRMREEGKECLVTLGLSNHSNSLYRQAGFEEVGRTPHTNHPVFIKRLSQ